MLISITQALRDLNTLNDRINREVSEAKFVATQVGTKKIDNHITPEEFTKRALASLQSIRALIKRRNEIKGKIVMSNATTKVKVAGTELTVAEAIERKTSIAYEKQLLHVLRVQYSNAISVVDRENSKVKERLDQHIQTMIGKDTKGKENDVEVLTRTFSELNMSAVVDPVQAWTLIQALTLEIENFENEVDVALSVINSTTNIEISE